MVDGLLGLRHHAVVGSDDDDGNVGHLGTTGTHSGERLVTRGVEEGDVTTILELDVVGTDVLGDATSLTCDDVGLADVVEKLGLTVIDVAHDSDDGRTRNKVLLTVGLLLEFGFNLLADVLSLETELFGHEVDGLGFEALVDADHQAELHTGHDDIGDRHIHHGGKVVDGHVLGEFEHLRLGSLLGLSLGSGGSSSVTLVLAVLDSLLVGLVGQTSEGVLNLPLYILFGDLLLVGIVALLLVLALVTTTTVGVLLILAVATLLALGIACLALLDYLVDIDLLGTTLTTAAMSLLAGRGAGLAVAALGLLLALLLAFLLGLLLGTGGLVEGVEVDGTEHIDLRLFGLVEAEHFAVASLGRQWFVIDTILATLAPDGLVGLLLGGSIGLLALLGLRFSLLLSRLAGLFFCFGSLRCDNVGLLLLDLLFFGLGCWNFLLRFFCLGSLNRLLHLDLFLGRLWLGLLLGRLLLVVEIDMPHDLHGCLHELLFGRCLGYGRGRCGRFGLGSGLLTCLGYALIDGIDLAGFLLDLVACLQAFEAFALGSLLDRFVLVEFLA